MGAIIEKLHATTQGALLAPELKDQFEREGAGVVTMSAAEFGAYIEAEIVKWSRVVKESGIKAN